MPTRRPPLCFWPLLRSLETYGRHPGPDHWDEGAGPRGVGEVAGELAPRVGRGDHVSATIEVYDHRVAVPGAWCAPTTSHGRGVLKAHALGLRSHVLGVLVRLSLVWEIHIHGLWGVAQYLVELEGFRTYHPRLLLPR